MTATITRQKTNREVVPKGRQAIWNAIRFCKEFTLQDLETTSGQSRPHCRRYLTALAYAGLVKVLDRAKGGNGENRYLLVLQRPGSLPPIPSADGRQVYDPNTETIHYSARGETPVDRAWATIRTGEVFVMADLAGKDMHQKSHLYKWLAGLLEAGYVRQVRAAKPGPGGWPAQYELQNDPGALAPVVDRNGKVLNPNQAT